MKPHLLAALAYSLLACLALAACTPPETPAQQAENAACTAQGDAVYNQDTINEAGHTLQNGLLYGATPTHVFDAERMGAEHQSDSQIQNCEQTGNNNGQPQAGGFTPVAPHIITN